MLASLIPRSPVPWSTGEAIRLACPMSGPHPGASPASVNRRRWERLPFAIPVFIRGTNGQGKEFLQLCTLLNESAGGALLATRTPLKRRSLLSLEIPSAPAPTTGAFAQGKRLLKARVMRTTLIEGWTYCGLQFSRPLIEKRGMKI